MPPNTPGENASTRIRSRIAEPTAKGGHPPKQAPVRPQEGEGPDRHVAAPFERRRGRVGDVVDVPTAVVALPRGQAVEVCANDVVGQVAAHAAVREGCEVERADQLILGAALYV